MLSDPSWAFDDGVRMRFDERVGIVFGRPRLKSISGNGIFVRASKLVEPADAGSAASTRVEVALDWDEDMGARMLTDGPWSAIPQRGDPLAVEILQRVAIPLCT